MHYNVVIIKELNSKIQLVLECVKASSDEIMKRLLAFMEEAHGRFSTLEQAVRGNSDRLSTMEHAIRGLKDDMLDMEHRLSSKINRITERCENHDCRLAALETHQ